MDLTVAICVYNAEKYIKETLECLSNQSRQDFRLLFINDCSTDNSVEIIREYFRKNPREYEVVDFEINKGLCAGRRHVEENTDSKYLLFIDADDHPLPDFVESLYDKITSDPQLMAVGCYLEYINTEGERIPGGIFIGEKTKEDFYKKAEAEKLIFMPSTSIYNLELALKVGGHNIDGFPVGKPRYQDLCEDLDLWTRMSDLYKDGYAIVVLPKVLYQYRKGDGMSMSSFGMLLRMRHIKSNLKRRRKGQPELSFMEFKNSLSGEALKKLEKEALSADLLRDGYYNLKQKRLLKGVSMVLKSFLLNPKYFSDKLKNNLLK